METHLPMTARVYVNLPEGNVFSGGISWFHTGKLRLTVLSLSWIIFVVGAWNGDFIMGITQKYQKEFGSLVIKQQNYGFNQKTYVDFSDQKCVDLPDDYCRKMVVWNMEHVDLTNKMCGW